MSGPRPGGEGSRQGQGRVGLGHGQGNGVSDLVSCLFPQILKGLQKSLPKDDVQGPGLPGVLAPVPIT